MNGLLVIVITSNYGSLTSSHISLANLELSLKLMYQRIRCARIKQ